MIAGCFLEKMREIRVSGRNLVIEHDSCYINFLIDLIASHFNYYFNENNYIKCNHMVGRDILLLVMGSQSTKTRRVLVFNIF